MELATFGAGCFWGVEAAFRLVPGVVNTSVGFMGGRLENPSYKDVCRGDTDHAEVIQVEYDPSIVSYGHLLETFWSCHNPTQLNRQGPDYGSQYRSVIFTHSENQMAAAEESKSLLIASNKFKLPIVTQILPALSFYPAEDYHQQYLEKRGLATCHL